MANLTDLLLSLPVLLLWFGPAVGIVVLLLWSHAHTASHVSHSHHAPPGAARAL